MKYMPRKKIYSGSNRKNTFDPDLFEARSYGHWVYALKIKGQVIFNDYNYSVTTRQHQHEMRAFLRNEMKVNMDKVIFVDQRASLTNGLLMDSQYERLALAEIRSKRKGMRAEFLKTQLDTIKKMKSEIKTLRRLGAKTSQPVDDIKARVLRDETERLEENRVAAKAQRTARKAIETEVESQFNSLDAVSI